MWMIRVKLLKKSTNSKLFKMGLPKIYDKKKALEKAKTKSKTENSVIYVIESSETSLTQPMTLVYYIDDNSFCRNWEKVVATFECGTKI